MQITIDPGVGGTGWAIWEDDWDFLRAGVITPQRMGLGAALDCTKLQQWQFGAEQAADRVYQIGKYCHDIYIEYPRDFGGSVATTSGALVKLSVLVGLIAGRFAERNIEFVPVNDWKGQLPKEVVEKRVKKLLPNCKATSHAIDAIGIGLYKKGVF